MVFIAAANGMVVFIVLGLIDPDGDNATSNMDWLPLFSMVGEVFRPSTWTDLSTSQSAIFADLSWSLLLLGVLVLAYAFASAVLGWLLHVAVLVIAARPQRRYSRAPGTGGRPAPESPARQAAPHRTSVAILGLAGFAAAVFSAVVTAFNGLQFWFVRCLYDLAHHAVTGYHAWSSFHDLVLLFVVCVANGLAAAMLWPLITSDHLNRRLMGLGASGLQLATLLTSTALWGVYSH